MRTELNDEPLDFSLVHADDALFDEIGCAVQPDLSLIEGDPVLEGLLAWRQGVDAKPIGNFIEQDEAVAVVQAARKRSA